MSWGPQDSAIKVEKGSELETAIANAKSSEEVVALMRDAMLSQRLVVADTINPDVLYETERVVPKSFARTISVNGKKTVIEAATELELERAVGELYRSLQPAEPTRDERGRFVEQQPVVLDDAESLASAAAAKITERHLIDLGIDPNALREVAAQTFSHSWEEAAESFRSSTPDWPGSDANRDALGLAVQNLGLVDAKDKLLALQKGWEYMKANNLVVENHETAAVTSRDEEIAACTTDAELSVCLAKWYPNSRSARSNQQFDR